MATYSSAQLAHALDEAFRHVLEQQPRQTLPSHIILDAFCMFVGGKLADMSRGSDLSPSQHEEFLTTFEHHLRLAVRATHKIRYAEGQAY